MLSSDAPQIEVDVLLFREGLEDEGLPKSKVDAQVEAHRAKLLAEIEAKSAAGGQPSTSQRWGHTLIAPAKPHCWWRPLSTLARMRALVSFEHG